MLINHGIITVLLVPLEEDKGTSDRLVIPNLGLNDEEIKDIKKFIVDLFSIDIITAKGDVTIELKADESVFDIAKSGTIKILARTIIQFGGDLLVIIPTSTGKGNDSPDTINQDIWQIHKENVEAALSNRKNDLEILVDIASRVIGLFNTKEQNTPAALALLRDLKNDLKAQNP